jgi:hypothetical protein
MLGWAQPDLVRLTEYLRAAAAALRFAGAEAAIAAVARAVAALGSGVSEEPVPNALAGWPGFPSVR